MEDPPDGSDADVRLLLEDEDAPTRIRAAWTLAMRLGAHATDELVAQQQREPSVGVRRHLIVILSGLHEVELLAAIARDDPHARVRATAVVCLARRVRDDRASADVVVARLRDEPDAEVHVAMVEALPNPAPPAIEGALERVIAGPRDDLRKTAILARVVAREGHAAAIALLDRRKPLSSRLRRRLIHDWAASAPAPRMVAALYDARWRTLECALAKAPWGSLPWATLAPVAVRDDPRLDLVLVRRADTRTAEHLPFFVTVLERARRSETSDPVCAALSAAVFAGTLTNGPLVERALAACERRAADDAGRRESEARVAVGSLRWLSGARDPDGWVGWVEKHGGATRIVHDQRADLIVRGGALEIGMSWAALEMLTAALGRDAEARFGALWERRTVTLRAGELAEMAACSSPGLEPLVTDLAVLARAAGSVELVWKPE